MNMDVVFILAITFGVIAIGSLLMFVATLFEPIYVPITLIALVLCIVFASIAGAYVKKNTEIHTEVVEMEITKCDMTSYYVSNSGECRSYYLTVGNVYVIEVSSDEYAKYNVGDPVLLEVETKTDPFNGTTETASLFEGD